MYRLDGVLCNRNKVTKAKKSLSVCAGVYLICGYHVMPEKAKTINKGIRCLGAIESTCKVS